MRRAASMFITVGIALVAVAGVPAPVSAADGKPRGGGKPCPAERVLAQPPFPPTNVNLFTPQTYAQAPPMVPAPPRRITEAQLRVQLAKALSPRAKRHPGVVARGLAVFDDRKIKKIIPDPNLRAALASLVGGPSEVSVDTIRSGLYARVIFTALPASTVAQVSPDAQGDPEILFNERYRFENFSLLGVAMAHETLHQDPEISTMEEYIAFALHSGYYGQVLLEQPKLATGGTELTRRTNTQLLALVNTRDAKGRQSLTANRGNVFPGGKPLANFRSIFPANLGPATPGNPDLDAFLSAMTKTRQRNANFDQATADLLDVRLLWSPPEGRLRVAKLLQLKLPKGCPPWPQPAVPTQIPAGDQPAEATAATFVERPVASSPASPLAATATVLSLLALLRLRRRHRAVPGDPRQLP
ncbi:hypothetical protein [Verrucosispora sp. WMMC514]|uniref:hypothetical protein n=1 Tax=Verrucosispora sp. WMMC514 TaxID=3015156 RepID=UPI00248B3874|nr:hypothetical protein [Verrucosispora sp. WMMC514]WBB93373.1 hypothetical protein O7597_10545 [Verrucosispora sp. WMMC514]